MNNLFVNGKYLGSQLNGVHRTAAYFTCALKERANEGLSVRVVAPRSPEGDENIIWTEADYHPGIFGAGQGWEMLTLPYIARNSLLVNFCNLAPVLHSNSVVMIHDAQMFLYPDDYSEKQAIAFRAFLPVIARRARKILTVSEYSKSCLVEYGIGSLDKIEVVYNGTDHILACALDEGALVKYNLQGRKFALVLGSSKAYKNIQRIFEVMSHSVPGGLTLVVAGGPSEEAYRARGWAPPKNTVFTGFVTDSELRALYSAATVFLFPSLTEGFGLPPLEAMHCGCAVVAANAGAMPEVCSDGALLVDPNCSKEWYDAIEKIVGDQHFHGALVRRGSERAKQFSWKSAGNRLWDVIRVLV